MRFVRVLPTELLRTVMEVIEEDLKTFLKEAQGTQAMDPGSRSTSMTSPWITAQQQVRLAPYCLQAPIQAGMRQECPDEGAPYAIG